MNHYKKLLFIFLLLLSVNSYGQDGKDSKKWFIVLPLRFTHLQNSTTMLSGIKVGRKINQQFDVSLSIYHSFYLNSFKPKINIMGLEKKPLLFINCVGGEVDYYFFNRAKISSSLQLLLGWGFMKYDLKEQNFTSQQVNYLAVEPTLHTEYKISTTTHIGLGIGYRLIASNKQIYYTSEVLNGKIPIHKTFPNGVNFILTFKGFL